MCLFYLYANAKIEIHICSNKHETGLVVQRGDWYSKLKIVRISSICESRHPVHVKNSDTELEI